MDKNNKARIKTINKRITSYKNLVTEHEEDITTIKALIKELRVDISKWELEKEEIMESK